VVNADLEELGDASGELSAMLDARQGEFGDDAGGEHGREDAGGCNGVLNGEVDADAADGGHGVGGVADAEKAGAVPAGEVIDLDGEEFDLVPVSEIVYAVGKEGNEAGDGGAEGGKASGLDHGGEGVLGDEEGALEVVCAIDEDGEVAVVDVADDVGGVVFMAAEAEPEDVDGNSGLANWQAGSGTGGGVAAVATDDEGSADVDRAGGSVGVDADDAMIVVFDEAGGLVFHEKAERWEGCGLRGYEVEEVPLGHESDEFCMRGQMTEIGDGEGFAADGEDKLADLLVRKGEEGVEDT